MKTTKERVNELEARSTEILQSEEQRENYWRKSTGENEQRPVRPHQGLLRNV